jgi:DNA ligase (NAD+)
MSRITTLRNQILKAKHAYYYSNEPVMTDAEYDALEDELRLLDANDPVLALVGSPVPANTMLTKARHSIPMGSQSKVNSEEEFRTWCTKNEVTAIHASLKGDGASAAAYYRDGQLVQAISRGDGTTGEDITANALRFKGLPAWVGTQDVGFNGAVRFEVILTVDDWTKIDPARSKNPRNAGNGIMGRKNGHQSDCLTIFAFDLDETRDGRSVAFQTESQKSARLAELGFNVIQHAVYEAVEDAIDYFRQIAETRDSMPIWIDGVVMKVDDIAKQRELGVTAGRPKGQIAWKFDSSGAETVLEGVVVSGGHTGGLYPTAQLRPVDIGGTTVSNASLANYDEIERLDVAIGDSVWVVKANDIIPKIIRVTERAATRQPILAPTVCPFCGGEVGRRRTTGGEDGVIIECRNAECPKKSTGKIRRWIASLEILGIGDVVLESMIERFDLADAADLYTLRARASELADLVTHAERDLRLGEKRTASILDAIDGTRALSLSQFLGSLGLDHLGKRRVELMMKSANGLLDRLEDWRSGLLRDPANAVKAGVPNIGGQIQDGIDAMSTVIDKLLAAGVTAAPISRIAGNDLAPETPPLLTICISGKLPSGKKKSDYEEPLLVAGYELVEDVTKGLNYLVLADPASNSSKAEKARKLGVTVISEEKLIQMVKSIPQQVPVVQKAKQTVEEIPMSSNSAGFKFDGQFQRFELVDEKSSKFWEIRVDGASVEVRYGKIGTTGQNQTKEFGDESAALRHAEKMVGEKLKGGYVSLSKAPQELGEQTKQLAQKLSTIDIAKKLKLDKNQILAGDFPKDLDLGDLQLDFEIFVHGPEVFSRAAKKGLAPQANLTISNNSALETLRIGCDDLGMSYVLIENCPNLKSIEVYLKSPRSDSAEPKWLICKDLPKLESFVAAGFLLSLQIEAAPSLKTVKVGKCQELGVLSLIGSSVLKELDINGCKKLPWVQGLTEEQEAQLYVESKVDANCTSEVDPSFPFKDLDFRQVNEVLEVINKGMMADFERGRPNQYDDDLSIQQYSIELLRPLEQTNTGGTGEQYAYQLVTEDGCGPDQLVGSTRGEHSPEDCLNSALRSATNFIIIDGVDDQSEAVVFDYLKKYGKEKVIAPEVHNEVAKSSPVVNERFEPTGSVDFDAPVIRTLCISGKLPSGLRKADYETALANVKIKLLDDVSQGLTYLVLADPASTSAKAEKARKLGVQVISEDQLIALTSGKWNDL